MLKQNWEKSYLRERLEVRLIHYEPLPFIHIVPLNSHFLNTFLKCIWSLVVRRDQHNSTIHTVSLDIN